MKSNISNDSIERAIFTCLDKKRHGASACPSEVACQLAMNEDQWRALMPEVRSVAARLQKAGKLRITQKGAEVDIEQAKGPIRLSLP